MLKISLKSEHRRLSYDLKGVPWWPKNELRKKPTVPCRSVRNANKKNGLALYPTYWEPKKCQMWASRSEKVVPFYEVIISPKIRKKYFKDFCPECLYSIGKLHTPEWKVL
jgi:hypothetical protein